MPLNHMGISAWIATLRGKEISQYAVKPRGSRSMECWIPASEGCHFKIMWRVLKAPYPDLDLFVYPYLDGVRLYGCSWTKDQVSAEEMGELGHHPIGPSAVRLYEFGKRKTTDKEDTLQTGRPRALLNELNTIKVRFEWGHQEAVVEDANIFIDPTESAPVHEEDMKLMQGLSGSVQLSQNATASSYNYSSCEFRSEDGVKSTTFIFHYAPVDWLKARDIISKRIPRTAGPSSSRVAPKRARKITSEAAIISRVDSVEARDDDDDDIIFVKHVLPAKPPPRKRKRLV